MSRVRSRSLSPKRGGLRPSRSRSPSPVMSASEASARHCCGCSDESCTGVVKSAWEDEEEDEDEDEDEEDEEALKPASKEARAGYVYSGVCGRNCVCQQTCCKKECLSHFTHFTLFHARNVGSGKKKNAWKDAVLENHKANFRFGAHSESILCSVGLQMLYNCSTSKIWKRCGNTAGDDQRKRSKKDIAIMSWLEDTIRYLDIMPDDGSIVIPAAKKITVYKWYQADCKMWPACYIGCSPSYFMTIWRDHFKALVCRKWLRFAKCTMCVELRAKRWDQSMSERDRIVAGASLFEHYTMMKKERAYCRTKMNKAIKWPNLFMQMSFDGTSQLAFGYPSWREQSHAEDESKYRIQSHLTVVCIAGKEILVFENHDFIFKGPDTTVEVIQRALKRYEKIYGRLPDTLYLQCDNCWRENKNHCLLCYLGSLVERGVFVDIEISFFYKGHTHFGPDQVASRISLACKHNDIMTREDNFRVIQNSYTPALT
jgi:hypothetical protein